MNNFDWEEFEFGKIAVGCNSKEKARDFLTECDKRGFRWQISSGSSLYGIEDIIYNQYKHDTYYTLDEDGIGFGTKQCYIDYGFKIIEWEIDKMKRKVYKIQDLLKDEFVGKDFLEVNLDRVFTVTGYGGCPCVEDLFGKLIEGSYDMIKILNMEFELLEEKEVKETNTINKSSKTYIAGSLFNQGEVTQRKNEEELLRQKGYENIYNPINAPCNNKEDLPTSTDIFWGDTEEILDSELVIADLSNATDLGVGCELGIIWACNHLHFLAEEGLTIEEILDEMKKKKLVAHLSDIRKSTAHQYRGNGIPVGFNQYMIGLVEDIGVIKDNFKEVLEELERVK